MHDTLAKPWPPHEAGTAVADNPAEAAELGAVEVAPVRFEYLQERGFFKQAAPKAGLRAVPVASSAVEPAPGVAAEPVATADTSTEGRA